MKPNIEPRREPRKSPGGGFQKSIPPQDSGFPTWRSPSKAPLNEFERSFSNTVDESQKSNLVKDDRQSGRFGRFLVLTMTFRDETSKITIINVFADFSICTIITTRLTNNILKDAVSDLNAARIFKDVCFKRVASQNVSTGKVFTFLSRFLAFFSVPVEVIDRSISRPVGPRKKMTFLFYFYSKNRVF